MSAFQDAESIEPAADLSQIVTAKAPSELRDEGNAGHARKDPDAAEAAHRALLLIDPGNIYGLVGLGLVARLRGDRDEAFRRFRNAAVAWPSHPWPLLEISAEYTALGAFAEAEVIAREALTRSPGHHYVQMALGRLLRRRGEREAAAEMFRGAAAADPSQTWCHIEWAAELAALGRREEALSALDRGARSASDKVAVQVARARMLRAEGRNEAALAAWKAALAEKPEQSALKLEIAAEIVSLGRPAEALAAHRAVLDDGAIDAAKRRAAALAAHHIARDQRNLPLSIALLEQAAALEGDPTQVDAELSNQYRTAGRLADAEAVYRKILGRSPTSLHGLGGLAIVRRQLGDSEAALECLRKAHAVDPRNDWIRLELAKSHSHAGRFDETGALLESIEPTSSMYAAARMTLGQMALARDAPRWAVEYFGQAARNAADPFDAVNQMVAVQCQLDDLVEAKATIARLFARDADSYLRHMALGYLERATNDRAEARESFQRAADLRPTETRPLLEIVVEARELGDDAGESVAIDAVLGIEPRHESALLKKAARLAERGEADDALALYAELRREWPASVWAYQSAAQLLATRGDFDPALALLENARETCPPHSAIDLCKAGILRQLGLSDQAEGLLSSVHGRFPSEPWPWVSLAYAAIELGLFDKAEALLARPPPLPGKDKARLPNLRAQLDKARWNLEAAIDSLSDAIAADPQDSNALYERAKLRLLAFDLNGARLDLEAHAALRAVAAAREGRSANASQTHVGQLLQEFVLDAEIADDLAGLRGISPTGQVPRLLEAVRKNPDSSGPALGLMIALRRGGRLDRPRPWRDSPPRIPQLITQFWNDPEPPPDIARLMSTWASDPAFRVEVFDDAEALAYLRERLGPEVARAFIRAKEPAQRADVFRLARIAREGGYFIDADDRAREGLAGHVPPDVDLFTYQEDLGSVANNVMGAAPGHPVIETALSEAVAAIARDDRDLIWLSTGPGLLTRSLARWLASDPSRMDERLGAVAIATLAEVRRAVTMHCHAAYKTTPRAWLNAAFAKRMRA